MSPVERDVLLIQLADELDDYRDLASNHAANADDRMVDIATPYAAGRTAHMSNDDPCHV
jgi:hypothetical protein